MKNDKLNKNIIRSDLKPIEYANIEEAIEKCRAYLLEHQKLLKDREIISNTIYLSGFSFVY